VLPPLRKALFVAALVALLGLGWLAWFGAPEAPRDASGTADAASPDDAAAATPSNGSRSSEPEPIDDGDGRTEAAAAVSEESISSDEAPGVEFERDVFLVGEVFDGSGKAGAAKLEIAALPAADAAEYAHRFASTAVTDAAAVKLVQRGSLRLAKRRASGAADGEGRYRIDVSEFFPGAAVDDAGLVLRVEVTAAGQGYEHLVVLRVDRRRFAAPSNYEFRADFALPQACRVALEVAAEGGESARMGAAVLEWSGGRPATKPVAEHNSDARELVFQANLESGKEYAVVAYGQGLRPQHQRFVAEGVTDLGAWKLQPGASISGRITAAGSPAGGMVRVAAAEPPDAARCVVDTRWLLWTGASFEWDWISVPSTAEGRFEVAGLAPGDYALSLGAVRGVCAPDLALGRVAAPAANVELALAICRVELFCTRGGAPAAAERFAVRENWAGAQRSSAFVADEFGRAELWLDPQRSTTLVFFVSPDGVARPQKVERAVDCSKSGGALAMQVDL
jgi:hypothetical protein